MKIQSHETCTSSAARHLGWCRFHLQLIFSLRQGLCRADKVNCCAGDIKPAGAPAPGPTVAPQINIVYIQQANNARMTPSPTDPNSGVLSMNGAIDTTLYDQVGPLCPDSTEAFRWSLVIHYVTGALHTALPASAMAITSS